MRTVQEIKECFAAEFENQIREHRTLILQQIENAKSIADLEMIMKDVLYKFPELARQFNLCFNEIQNPNT